MSKNTKTYDIDKLNDLKRAIKERETELFSEINVALGNNDTEAYTHLKQEQLQCTAELRLIRYLENGLEGDFTIC